MVERPLPSRRRAMGALAAAIAATSLSPARAAPPTTTALLTLIQAHREANAAFRAAVDAREAAQPDWDADIPNLGPRAKPYCPLYSTPDDLIQQIERDFVAETRNIAPVRELSPALGEQALAILEARRAFCLGRIEEVYAKYYAAEPAYWNALAVEDQAIAAIRAYRCASIEEAGIRANYLAAGTIELQQEHVDALLASFIADDAEAPETANAHGIGRAQ